ncbi:NADH dehydrogenase [ubiquinone] 1 alpha subcomplex subunit 6-like [Sycon ciliatum]|uniref:NADH dehydrogenase [ubiquinone] 1 alpha subcomplex subunit 6-like n=1 Tax=Sycon ciliatum TaxID=27933 RepID=UPI0020AA4D28|eukprot:scpid80515/ scgid25050/ NADH dehydrogenase [ubiquinone] 1 alpha subcomplex subunit 6; Complex I-B14; NADH-ubiquinone oxidoreductase B14 subunit
MSAGRAASLVVKDLPKGVKPLLSSNQDEARLRVLSLYKAWMRQASAACKKQDLGISEETAKAKIRAEFAKNQAVQDLRVVDSLIKKGTLLLEETSLGWQVPSHVMRNFEPTARQRKTDFMSKFYRKNFA